MIDETKTLQELKAEAFECMRQAENWAGRLRQLVQAIERLEGQDKVAAEFNRSVGSSDTFTTATPDGPPPFSRVK